MALTEIEELLTSRLGFDIETIGARAVDTMVRRAMEHAGFSDAEAYASVLRRDPEAWERFVDHVVIPETWFFRDVAPFELAADLLYAHLHAGSNRGIRILSCPCSTGEEPYSLVVAMLLTGAPPDSFCVDAVDVSRRALKAARAAVFGTRSFRGDFPWDHESYFERAESDGSRRLNAAARACVRFQQGNIIAHDFLEYEEPYDVVFCRNLLIYLHAEARVLAMAALHRLLAENGVLVLGHAEAAFAREHGFTPTGPTGAFAFLKSSEPFVPKREAASSWNSVTNVSKVSSRTPTIASPVRPSGAPFVAPSFAAPPSASSVVPSGAPTDRTEPTADRGSQPQESASSLLETASQLGDAGQLHSALQMCSTYLQHVPDSPEGHFLLGVLHDALGDTDLAVSSFRKALYLDPTHRDALLWLALKQESRGDASGAALLRERAARSENGQDK